MEVTIAGRVIADPVEVVAHHLRARERHIRGYDLHPQESPDRITAQDVLATKHVDSRIGGDGVQFFLDRSRTAPWHAVPADAHLADADPADEDGLYDAAEDLYRHFYTDRLRGMTPAKIHKVLHLKRPALIPILDGRLQHLYGDRARALSRELREVRRGRRGRLYWAAIREDVVANAEELAAVRAALADREGPDALGAELTDLRLLDIFVWELAPGSPG